MEGWHDHNPRTDGGLLHGHGVWSVAALFSSAYCEAVVSEITPRKFRTQEDTPVLALQASFKPSSHGDLAEEIGSSVQPVRRLRCEVKVKSSLRSVGTIDQFTLGILREIDKQYPFHNFSGRGGRSRCRDGPGQSRGWEPDGCSGFQRGLTMNTQIERDYATDIHLLQLRPRKTFREILFEELMWWGKAGAVIFCTCAAGWVAGWGLALLTKGK